MAKKEKKVSVSEKEIRKDKIKATPQVTGIKPNVSGIATSGKADSSDGDCGTPTGDRVFDILGNRGGPKINEQIRQTAQARQKIQVEKLNLKDQIKVQEVIKKDTNTKK